jgi:hypothetical protein
MERLFEESEILTLSGDLNSYDKDVHVKVELNINATWKCNCSVYSYWDGGATGCDSSYRDAFGTFEISGGEITFYVQEYKVRDGGGQFYVSEQSKFTIPLKSSLTFSHPAITDNLAAKLDKPIENLTPEIISPVKKASQSTREYPTLLEKDIQFLHLWKNQKSRFLNLWKNQKSRFLNLLRLKNLLNQQTV